MDYLIPSIITTLVIIILNLCLRKIISIKELDDPNKLLIDLDQYITYREGKSLYEIID